MLPEQYREFMSMLMAHFGRGGYFYRRRGVIAMPPAEQEIVLNALHAVGIRDDIQFDAYEELVNWFDWPRQWQSFLVGKLEFPHEKTAVLL